MSLKKPATIQMALVIVDSRDATKDIQMPLTKAKEMYDRGELVWSIENRQYMFDDVKARSNAR